MYIALLKRIGRGDVPKTNLLDQAERRIAIELIDSGLVSDLARNLGDSEFLIKEHLVITPEGITTLTFWEEHIRKSSWQYKIGSSLSKFFWLVTGAVIVSFQDILKCLNT